jgi:uncharacterized membrane protein YeiB
MTTKVTQPCRANAVSKMMSARSLPLIALLFGLGLATCVERSAPAQPPPPAPMRGGHDSLY